MFLLMKRCFQINKYPHEKDYKKNCHLENINGSFDMPITEIFDTQNILDCIVMDNGTRTYYTLGKIESEDTLEFITEYQQDDRVYGSFSKGGDVVYSIKR